MITAFELRFVILQVPENITATARFGGEFKDPLREARKAHESGILQRPPKAQVRFIGTTLPNPKEVVEAKKVLGAILELRFAQH